MSGLNTKAIEGAVQALMSRLRKQSVQRDEIQLDMTEADVWLVDCARKPHLILANAR